MPPKKRGPSQEAVDDLVKHYLVDKIREHAGQDEALLDSVLALQDLAEQREKGSDPAKRLAELRDSPMIRTAMAFLGERFRRLADVGVRLAQDTQELRLALRERLGECGIDPSDPKQLAAAEAEYERALVAIIPLETALENVDALAEMVDLANDVLNQEGLKRHAYEAAWHVGKRTLFSDAKVLAKMEEVKGQLQGDRKRLERIAALIRKVGPGVVKAAYKRGAKPDETAPAKKAGAAAPARKIPGATAPARKTSGSAPAKKPARK